MDGWTDRWMDGNLHNRQSEEMPLRDANVDTYIFKLKTLVQKTRAAPPHLYPPHTLFPSPILKTHIQILPLTCVQLCFFQVKFLMRAPRVGKEVSDTWMKTCQRLDNPLEK